VPLDLTLNVVWLLLGVLALAISFGMSSRRPGSRRWQLARIILVLAALFPFVSATDDILRVEHYTSDHDGQHSHGRTPNDDLVRLYEAMDAPVIAQASGIAFVLLFVSFVTIAATTLLTRVAPYAAGRSPPYLLLSV
jgi:hypothetical protein